MKSFKIGDLTIKLPIIQGGMGVGISLSGLASAVANEGGVGVISCAGMGLLYPKFSKDYLTNSIMGLKEEIRKARAKTRGVIGVNVMVALSNFSDMVKTSIAEKADIIFSGAGLPLDLPSYLQRESTTKLVPIVSSARAAKIICEKWKANYDYLPDAIVVEGPKAGGHLGYKNNQIDDANYSLEHIVPEVVAEARHFEKLYGRRIPVIAAGGLYTGGEFIRRVREGLTRPKKCPFHCIKTCDYTKSPYCIIMALYNAAKGNLSRGYAFAGANAFLSKKITSVRETIASLQAEFRAAELRRKRGPLSV